MRTTRQFSITLPNEMADMVLAKVQAGEYASESEVIREGLRTLALRDRALERWLHTEVCAAYDELQTNPSTGLTLEQVKKSLTESRRRRTTARK